MAAPVPILTAQSHLRAVDKSAPTEHWIDHLRKRYPTESEIDRVLTRRLRSRATSRYAPSSLDALVAAVTALIGHQLEEPFAISDARWLGGGASKLQMAFTLDWLQPGRGRTRTPMVLRMEPAESIVETSRMREFQLIKAFECVVPVPPVYWLDSLGEYLPYPGLVYGLVAGAPRPAAGSVGVSGLGTNLGPELRARLAPQLIRHLAAIHTFDFADADLSAFDIPAPGRRRVGRQLVEPRVGRGL